MSFRSLFLGLVSSLFSFYLIATPFSTPSSRVTKGDVFAPFPGCTAPVAREDMLRTSGLRYLVKGLGPKCWSCLTYLPSTLPFYPLHLPHYHLLAHLDHNNLFPTGLFLDPPSKILVAVCPDSWIQADPRMVHPRLRRQWQTHFIRCLPIQRHAHDLRKRDVRIHRSTS
jgi:hypothetical protein